MGQSIATRNKPYRKLHGFEQFTSLMSINAVLCISYDRNYFKNLMEDIERAIKCLVMKHPYLRCREKDGELISDPSVNLVFQRSTRADGHLVAGRELQHAANNDHPISEGTFRTSVVLLNNDCLVVLFQVSHACSDGTSLIGLVRNFLELLSAKKEPVDVESYEFRDLFSNLDWQRGLKMDPKPPTMWPSDILQLTKFQDEAIVQTGTLSQAETKALMSIAKSKQLGIQSCLSAAVSVVVVKACKFEGSGPVMMVVPKQFRDMATGVPEILSDEFVTGAAAMYCHFHVSENSDIWELATEAHAQIRQGLANDEHFRFLSRMAQGEQEPPHTFVCSSIGLLPVESEYTGIRVEGLHVGTSMPRAPYLEPLMVHAATTVGVRLGWTISSYLGEDVTKRISDLLSATIKEMADTPLSKTQCSVSPAHSVATTVASPMNVTI
eukprot:GHVO01017418.1.p1 GENE.GHVO01017418.1~~GHVO01017418.1.p1  ORF type:complete len:447 (+),score=46.24 GHVO01017418.1:28-1341(+)